MNIYIYQMLRSYGVQAGSCPKTEVKNETHTSGLERVILTFETLVSVLLNRMTLNDSKFMYLPFGKSIYLEEFNMVVLLSNSQLLKEEIVQRSRFTR